MADLIGAGRNGARRLRERAAGLGRRVEQRGEARRARGPELARHDFDWMVDQLVFFQGRGYVVGWIATTPRAPERVHVLAPDGALLGMQRFETTADGRAPFSVDFAIDDPNRVADARLRVVFADGAYAVLDGLVHPKIAADPYHSLTNRFFAECRELGERSPGARVLEIGSRARSGHVRRDLVAPMEYVGFDILAGDNTDVVGDAHDLTAVLEPKSFDAIFSISTFEHLAMPWKAALEINRVLKPGGRVMISSHQAFPLHDRPWDFWRFSDMAWHSLFNPRTGFRVVDTALGESAGVVAHLLHSVTVTLELNPAFIGSVVLAEKVGETDLSWPVDVAELTETMYPT